MFIHIYIIIKIDKNHKIEFVLYISHDIKPKLVTNSCQVAI